MTIDSRTVWNGMVAVPDWKVSHCISKKEDLTIKVGSREMTTKCLDIRGRVIMKSKPQPDKFNQNGGKDYILLYFKWNPESYEEKTKKLLGL